MTTLLLMLASLGQSPTIAPTIPLAADPAERAVLTRAAITIEDGKFAEALTLLQTRIVPKTTHVYLDAEALEAALQAPARAALTEAMARLGPSVGKLTTFRANPTAAGSHLVVRLLKQPLSSAPNTAPPCLQFGMLDEVPKERRAVVNIAMPVLGSQEMHSEEQLGWLMQRALAMYLGMPAPESGIEVFEADSHDDVDRGMVPSDEDIALLNELAEVRRKLIQFAEQKKRIHVPKAQLTAEPKGYDAGSVMRGDFVEAEFKLTNTGDAPLELLARPGCGCTVVTYDRRVPPGGSTVLRARLATAGFRGRISKVVTISSNDTVHPTQVLTMTADVRPIIRLESEAPRTVALREEGETSHEFRVTVGGTQDVEVTGVTASPRAVSAKFELDSVTGKDRHYKVRVTFPETLPVGQSRASVVIQTNSPREKSRSVPFTLVKGIAISGLSVSLGRVDSRPGEATSTTVALQRPGKPFQITKIECDDPLLKTSSEPLPDNAGYRVKFTYEGGWPEGRVSRVVTIHTDDPKQSEFKVTVLAQVVAGR